MADLIDREGMLKFLIKQNGCHGWKESHYSAEWVYSWLESQDEVEAEPVKHGRWVRPEGFYWRPECSECGYYGSVLDEPIIPFNYCPNCGAKMDGEDNAEK